MRAKAWNSHLRDIWEVEAEWLGVERKSELGRGGDGVCHVTIGTRRVQMLNLIEMSHPQNCSRLTEHYLKNNTSKNKKMIIMIIMKPKCDEQLVRIESGPDFCRGERRVKKQKWTDLAKEHVSSVQAPRSHDAISHVWFKKNKQNERNIGMHFSNKNIGLFSR